MIVNSNGIEAKLKFKWNNKTKKILEECGNKISYEIARRTLDLTVPTIPMDTGKMRATSMSAGVRGSNGNYVIGSYTTYAKDVWNYNDNKTNWTTPNTNSKWYSKVWKEKGNEIARQAIERNLK